MVTYSYSGSWKVKQCGAGNDRRDPKKRDQMSGRREHFHVYFLRIPVGTTYILTRGLQSWYPRPSVSTLKYFFPQTLFCDG